MTPPSGLRGASRSSTSEPSRSRVEAAPNPNSSSGTGQVNASTGLLETQTTTNRSAAAATIFSRRWAPPPPLISQPSGVTSSVPSMAMSSRVRRSKSSTGIPSSRACSSVATEVATQRIPSRPRRAIAGSRWATVEPVPKPTVIPLSTNSAAASAASRFSSSAELTIGTLPFSNDFKQRNRNRNPGLQGRRYRPRRFRPQGDLPRRGRDARPDADPRGVRRRAAAERRADHRLPPYDDPDRGPDRDPGRPRGRGAVGQLQHLQYPGPRRRRDRRYRHPRLRLERRDAGGVLVVHREGAELARRRGPEHDPRRRRRRHPARPQGGRVREGRRRARSRLG